MAQELIDFADIFNAVREEIGVQADDTVRMNRIKRNINLAYLDEVVPHRRWYWLEGNVNVIHKMRHNIGTVAVTEGSVTATLSYAPDVALGSFTNYTFKANGFDEIYLISAHTAGSTTITLTSAYQGEDLAVSAYRIWRPTIDLPIDARETVDIWHDRLQHRGPMVGYGPQELRKYELHEPVREGFPECYAPGDYFDPTSGDAESETDRYRQVRIYPAACLENVTMHVNYVKEAPALDLDGDEPLLPLEDRIVLLYGGLARSWISVARNPEEANRNQLLFGAKLSRMASKNQDGNDFPTIAPSSQYLRRFRYPLRKSWYRW